VGRGRGRWGKERGEEREQKGVEGTPGCVFKFSLEYPMHYSGYFKMAVHNVLDEV